MSMVFVPASNTTTARSFAVFLVDAAANALHKLSTRIAEAGLQQFIEMLQRDRAWGDSLAKKSLIDAFRVIEDEDLVGRYRRKMSSLLLV